MWWEVIALWLNASGNAAFLRANSRLERPQSRLAWDPDLEEASEAPPYILLIDNGFPTRPLRRRRPVSAADSLSQNTSAYRVRASQDTARHHAEKYQPPSGPACP